MMQAHRYLLLPLVLAGPAQAQGKKRFALPPASRLEKMTSWVQEMYRGVFKRGPAQYVDTLLTEALRLDVPGTAWHHAVLREVLTVSREQGLVEQALTAFDRMNSDYEFDGDPTALCTRLASTCKPRDRKGQRLLSMRFLELVESAIGRDPLVAITLQARGMSAAKKSGDSWCRSELVRAKRVILALEKIHQLRDKLGDEPQSPSLRKLAKAIPEAVRFHLDRRGDWRAALELLELADKHRGGVRDSIYAADRKLGASGLPDRAERCFHLAGRWWEHADREEWPELKGDFLSRAEHWFEQAVESAGTKEAASRYRMGLEGLRDSRSHLSDMKELKAKVGRYQFGKGDDLGHGKKSKLNITVGGRAVTHGLSTHPASSGVAYVLYSLMKKRWRELRGSVAIDDSAKNRTATPLVFEILVNGDLRWRSSPPVSETGKQLGFRVRLLKTVRKLELRVRCKGSADGARAVWVDPYLVK